MWESATVNGEIYTIPANWCEQADQNNGITIRREKLEEFGLEAPQTMDDLLNMCKVFTENWDGSNKPVVIPMYKEPFTYLFRTLAVSYTHLSFDGIQYNPSGSLSSSSITTVTTPWATSRWSCIRTLGWRV